jgi:IS1 family transposase/transposase-like protein
MQCPKCQEAPQKYGRTKDGRQRYQCRPCQRILVQPKPRPAVEIRLPQERMLLIAQLLVEGVSLRAVERLTGTDKKTSMRLLSILGAGCERLMSTLIQNVPVRDVECDEIWSYIKCKNAVKEKRKITDPTAGDSYTFIGIERTSKIVLAFQLGKRSTYDAQDFMTKLAKATGGKFQLSTDGYTGYPDSVEYAFGSRVDYGQVIKEFKAPTGPEARRYAPPTLIRQEKISVLGDPDETAIGTSRIERANWTLRTHLRRMTRLSNGFSRKKENLRANLALFFAYYNFVKIHNSIRCTPGMAAGLVNKPWSVADLVKEALAA